MKRFFFLLTFLATTLLGCSSFNNSFNTYTLPAGALTPSPEAPVALTTADKDMVDDPVPTPPAPSKAITAALGNACPVSPWPEPGNPPSYPYQDLLAAGGDLGRVEKIERKHINELRAYISERRSLNKEARDEFSKKCTAVRKS